MIQPHNRNMSLSLYLATLAVVDTVILAIGEYFQFGNGYQVTTVTAFMIYEIVESMNHFKVSCEVE